MGSPQRGHYTHTAKDLAPWWRTDLLAVYKVSVVTVINIPDGLMEIILGSQILIRNSLEQKWQPKPTVRYNF